MPSAADLAGGIFRRRRRALPRNFVRSYRKLSRFLLFFADLLVRVDEAKQGETRRGNESTLSQGV